jgi:hypothetical protein
LRGTQPVIVCPARGIENMRLPNAWKQPLAENRLLIISPFFKKRRRATADTSRTRNLFVAALADQILVPHAGSGSTTEEFCQNHIAARGSLWTLPSKENAALTELGAKVLTVETVWQFQSTALRK